MSWNVLRRQQYALSQSTTPHACTLNVKEGNSRICSQRVSRAFPEFIPEFPAVLRDPPSRSRLVDLG